MAHDHGPVDDVSVFIDQKRIVLCVQTSLDREGVDVVRIFVVCIPVDMDRTGDHLIREQVVGLLHGQHRIRIDTGEIVVGDVQVVDENHVRTRQIKRIRFILIQRTFGHIVVVRVPVYNVKFELGVSTDDFPVYGRIVTVEVSQVQNTLYTSQVQPFRCSRSDLSIAITHQDIHEVVTVLDVVPFLDQLHVGIDVVDVRDDVVLGCDVVPTGLLIDQSLFDCSKRISV